MRKTVSFCFALSFSLCIEPLDHGNVVCSIRPRSFSSSEFIKLVVTAHDFFFLFSFHSIKRDLDRSKKQTDINIDYIR